MTDFLICFISAFMSKTIFKILVVLTINQMVTTFSCACDDPKPGKASNAIPWSPIKEHISSRSYRFKDSGYEQDLVKVTYEPSKQASFTLSHWVSEGDGERTWRPYPDAIVHSHKISSKDIEELSECDEQLQKDISLAELKLRQMRPETFEEQKFQLIARRLDILKKMEALLKRSSEMFFKKSRLKLIPEGQVLEEEFNEVENQIKALKTNMADAKLIEQAILIAKNHLLSHQISHQKLINDKEPVLVPKDKEELYPLSK